MPGAVGFADSAWSMATVVRTLAADVQGQAPPSLGDALEGLGTALTALGATSHSMRDARRYSFFRPNRVATVAGELQRDAATATAMLRAVTDAVDRSPHQARLARKLGRMSRAVDRAVSSVEDPQPRALNRALRHISGLRQRAMKLDALGGNNASLGAALTHAQVALSDSGRVHSTALASMERSVGLLVELDAEYLGRPLDGNALARLQEAYRAASEAATYATARSWADEVIDEQHIAAPANAVLRAQVDSVVHTA